MRDKIRGNSLSYFDIKTLNKAAKKASDRGVAQATAYMWKVTRNSVKKGSAGKEKKYDLKMFLSARDKKRGNLLVGEKTMNAKEYFSRPNRAKEQTVIRDKLDTRNPKTQGSYVVRKPSVPWNPPKTHKTKRHC